MIVGGQVVERVIVKVQKSLSPPGGVLIYDRNRVVHHEGNLSSDIEAALHGQDKAYFYALWNPVSKLITLDSEATTQDW